MGHPDFELVSFALCPFVQRTAITLLHKQVPFRTTYVDLGHPPDWFRAISPLGKVPLLRVREEGAEEPAVLFESAVINEYVDEITPPSLQAATPLARARERAWVEVSSDLLMKMYQGLHHPDRAAGEELFHRMFDVLARTEAALPGGRFFRGEEFSLVDAAFAPFFTRLELVPFFRRTGGMDDLPKVRKWAASLVRMPEVRDSVRPDFAVRYRESLAESGSRFAA